MTVSVFGDFPVPDDRHIGDPGHIQDHAELAEWIVDYAKTYEVEIPPITVTPKLGAAGHLQHHDELIAAGKAVAESFGDTEFTWPTSHKADDPGHVTDHDLIVYNFRHFHKNSKLRIEGGAVSEFTYKGTKYRGHIWESVGASTAKATGTGSAYVLVVGGGGGGGGGELTNDYYFGGGGGGGQVIAKEVQIEAGIITLVVGAGGGGGGSVTAAGGNGDPSKCYGTGFDLTAAGGGGGGAGKGSAINGQPGACGGGGGAGVINGQAGPIGSGGNGSPGGRGAMGFAPPSGYVLPVPGAGGGSGPAGNATQGNTQTASMPGDPIDYSEDIYGPIIRDYEGNNAGGGGAGGGGTFGTGGFGCGGSGKGQRAADDGIRGCVVIIYEL